MMTTTTTTTAPVITEVITNAKTPVAKIVIASKIDKKKKKKSSKKKKKSKKISWKLPDNHQKKLFNDYKTILQTKMNARISNITTTYQLEPIKYSSKKLNNKILHHFLIKLPDSKFAHIVIKRNKNEKKRTLINENNVIIRRTISKNLVTPETL